MAPPPARFALAAGRTDVIDATPEPAGAAGRTAAPTARAPSSHPGQPPDAGRRRATPQVVTVPRARPATSGPAVTRLADASGNVSFAGASYRAGHQCAVTG